VRFKKIGEEGQIPNRKFGIQSITRDKSKLNNRASLNSRAVATPGQETAPR